MKLHKSIPKTGSFTLDDRYVKRQVQVEIVGEGNYGTMYRDVGGNITLLRHKKRQHTSHILICYYDVDVVRVGDNSTILGTQHLETQKLFTHNAFVLVCGGDTLRVSNGHAVYYDFIQVNDKKSMLWSRLIDFMRNKRYTQVEEKFFHNQTKITKL